ncbi:hypothetical protein TFLX_00196 [Thermoflexales bacterium]|nr:hypothetical protein TFLX_00196 [Thermoflexales bacterium]
MKRTLFAIGLTLLLAACTSTTNQVAEFDDTRFTYDHTLAISITTQWAPETIMLGAYESGSTPQHALFTLAGYNPQYDQRHQQPEIAVYLVANFKRVNSYFKDQALSDLTKLLVEKPASITSTIRLPSVSPGCCFAHMLPKYLKFPNGSGVRFITYQRGQSIDPLANANLAYVFHGLTDDRQHYISAIFPVSVSFLPRKAATKNPAIDMQTYISATLEYNEEVVRKIAALESGDFQPNLNLLDEMLQSLQTK